LHAIKPNTSSGFKELVNYYLKAHDGDISYLKAGMVEHKSSQSKITQINTNVY